MVKLGIIKEDNIMSDNTNNGFPVPEEPLTREEQYLSAIAGVTEATEIPEMPLTRVETYLNKIVEEGGDITDKLEAGTNIVIEETSDGKAKISASGEVSSEDTYARGEIQAILDGATIDSFGDVETALADKVDKVEGKGLSANDFTDTLKTKLDGIAAGAEVNVQADWNQTTDTADDYIKNKPNLATVATSGSYNDLSNKPSIPAAQVNSDWNAASGVAQILNKPTLGTAAAAATTDFATAAQGTKADSAIQGVKVGSTTLTPDSGKAVTITKNDITGLGIPAQDTTYEFESTYNASTNKAATMADIKDGVLTGYAQSSGNVAATDKVIEAIGKVEKKADTNEYNISINKNELIELVDSGDKNIIDNTLVDGSQSGGVTATVSEDKQVTLSGSTTSSDAVFATSTYVFIPAGTYIGSGCPSGGATDKYRIDYIINDSTVYRDTGNGVEFTVNDGDVIRSQIVVYRGNTAPSAAFALMVCLKSAYTVSPTYQPHKGYDIINGRRVYVADTAPTGTIPTGAIWIGG